MLLLNIALLALSALPTSLARHHRSPSLTTTSTFATLTSTSNATIPLTTMSSATGSPGGGLAACPTVTVQVQKVDGACPGARCLPLTPIFPVTSTTTVSCTCPAAMATRTTSVCDLVDPCFTTTSWVYRTTGAC